MERLYRRKVPVASLLTPELARQLAEISRSLHRQVGVLLDRQGVVSHVLVGDAKGLIIPPLPRERGVKGRLKGLRLIHTHLDASPLTRDDLMDLALLRLDAVAAVSAGADGQAGAIQVAHLLPRPLDGHNWAIIEASHPGALNLDFAALVASLEEELAQVETAGEEGRGRERAILIGVSGKNRAAAEDSMEELSELARSAGLEVAATLIQRRPRFDPRFLMGKGRLSELVVQGLQQGADLLVFDSELSPSQVRSITDFTELKVLDRTQLILDLFAQRARSREGKLQVEMAQVNYLLPRLVGKGDALSRLMGGIGGRGPGESKLEMDRRRLRDRLHRLRSELA
ncbi:MAG: GTPase HflX, partial [Desulfobaccales bacterium]